MKTKFILPLLAIVFILSACSNSKDTKSKDDTEETDKKKKKSGDEEESSDEKSSDEESSNGSDPADVVRTIIKAIKTGNYSALSGLCASDADGDSKDLCNLENLIDRQEEYKDFFGNAKVVGDSEISGNEAAVKIQSGGKEETLNLVKEGKKWKLSGF